MTGFYYMQGGLAQGNKLTTGQPGGFAQTGGAVDFAQIDVNQSSYQLTNGSLHCGSLHLTTNALFSQKGGTCILTNGLLLCGDTRPVAPQYSVEHDMSGGEFFAPSLLGDPHHHPRP